MLYFNLLSVNGLLIRKKKRSISTTMSYHRYHKWPNLIKEFTPTAADQLYVSDITYWKTDRGFLFISLLTDAFSHKVVGYHVADTLETIASIHLCFTFTQLKQSLYSVQSLAQEG